MRYQIGDIVSLKTMFGEYFLYYLILDKKESYYIGIDLQEGVSKIIDYSAMHDYNHLATVEA
jgi:hypothetical protein